MYLSIQGFPGGSVAKNPPANAGAAGDTGSIPGSGRLCGEKNGQEILWIEEPAGLQYMGSQKSWTQLGD